MIVTLPGLFSYLFFNKGNKRLTEKLLKQEMYHNVHKTVSKFYRRHSEFTSKYNVGLKHCGEKVYQ